MRIIAGEARSRQIEAPRGRDTRPTLDRVRENLFNILQNHVRGAQVLDLFSGSGALALEAISRGAAHAVLCDHDREANRIEQKNAAALHFEDRMEILLCDWSQALARMGGRKFDLVFLDPPYAMHDLREVTARLRPLMSPEGLLICEHQAESPYLVDEAFTLTDRRRYGYAGISIYRQEEQP